MITLHMDQNHGIRSKSKLDDIVEKSLRDAAIWDEVKDRLKEKRTGYVRWSAAETLHCQSTGSSAGGTSDG
jgi:3a0107s01c2: phosphate ABC transporter, ATP-binding protein